MGTRKDPAQHISLRPRSNDQYRVHSGKILLYRVAGLMSLSLTAFLLMEKQKPPCPRSTLFDPKIDDRIEKVKNFPSHRFSPAMGLHLSFFRDPWFWVGVIC